MAVPHVEGLAAAAMEGLPDRPPSDRRIQEAVRCLNRQFPNVAGAEVVPKVVIGGTIVQPPQIGRIDLEQEAIASIVERIRLEAPVRHVVQRMTPGVVYLPAQPLGKAAKKCSR